jgi:xylulokinase
MSEGHQSSKYVLAIDLGTGGAKVGLVDQQAKVICSAFAPLKVFFLPNGGVEHDANEWWSVISGCAKKVLTESRVAPEAVMAIGVTSMWSVIVAVDEKGEPLMNALSWMDHRGAIYNHEIMKGFPSVQGFQLGALLKYLDLHGFVPTETDDLAHMLFIKEERPEVYQRTYKFFEPMDFINMKLTGKFAATQNTALPSIMVENRKLDCQEYHPWLLKMGGIDREKLPDLLPIEGILGTVKEDMARDWGLSPSTLVICGVQDNSVSAIGAGSIGTGEPAAVMGTSGHMAFHLPFKKTDIDHTICTIPSAVKSSYLFWADIGNNGRVLESFLRNFIYAQDCFGTGAAPANIYECADRMAAESPAGSDGVLFLPWFNGTISPGEDPYLRGGFLNLSHKSNRSHMMRAVFEGMAMNWRWLRVPAEKLAGRTFQYWRLTGGGALSDVLSQIMADAVDRPMQRQSDARNSSMIGIGLLAFQRLGLVKLEDIPNLVHFDRTFEPDPKNRATYNRLFDYYLEAKDRLKPLYHSLNKA